MQLNSDIDSFQAFPRSQADHDWAFETVWFVLESVIKTITLDKLFPHDLWKNSADPNANTHDA